MALTIEDGTGKADAESYATVAELTAYAAKYGLQISHQDAPNEEALRKAADYLEGREHELKGVRSTDAQRLAFPRSGVVMFRGMSGLDSDEIPERLKEAQMRLAVIAQTTDLRPQGDGREVIEEKLDVISTKYNPTGSNQVQPVFAVVDDILKPLIRRGLEVLRG